MLAAANENDANVLRCQENFKNEFAATKLGDLRERERIVKQINEKTLICGNLLTSQDRKRLSKFQAEEISESVASGV